jgi:hypothetical protein
MAGTVGLLLSLHCFQHFTGRQIGVRKIFDGLKPKLWMTAGVGFFFFIFYLAVVLIGTNLMNSEMRLKLFDSMRNNPILFVYLGLFLFVMISISILGVRSIIKRIYNSRG